MYIIIGIIIVIVILYALGSSETETQNYVIQENGSNTVKITERDETEASIKFTIHIPVDSYDSHQFFCTIDKKGSPWVDVQATHFDDPGEFYEYNARHSRWKDGNKPFWIEKGMKKATKIIREQWDDAKDKHGWTYKKKETKPVTAEISTKKINLVYEEHYLEKLPDNIKIQGSDENPYQVNLKKLSCTCPDFFKRRSEFPKGDIRRICKHQAKAIIQTKNNTKITKDLKIQNIIRQSQEKGFHVFDECIQVTFNDPVRGPNPFYMFFENYSDWVDVIYFTPRSYFQQGYNIDETRWSYGKSPFPSGSIRKYDKAIEKALDKL